VSKSVSKTWPVDLILISSIMAQVIKFSSTSPRLRVASVIRRHLPVLLSPLLSAWEVASANDDHLPKH
jgi:hypothetical protein